MGLQGEPGLDGEDGIDGKDANETCKQCHNPGIVSAKMAEFDYSKHNYGEAAFEEAGNATCGPCHNSEAFKYVSKNNVPATYTLNSSTGKYSNDYVATSATSFGEFNCTTCHASLHTNYVLGDFAPLTNTAAVQMTMWKGAKSINPTQDDGTSNLCVKCHQPRPMSASSTLSNGDVVDYADLAANPGNVYYDSSVGNASPNKLVPSYRTHVHYGTVGAVFAGKGGVEFTGSQTYTSSTHTTAASCEDCHMYTVSGRTGGHTFFPTLTSCNQTGCHSSAITTSSTFYKTPRTEIQTLLNTLASKINAVGGGTDILHVNDDAEENLWYSGTTNHYDGYLNIFDASNNPAGVWRNPAPSSSWPQADKDYNLTLTTFPSLKNVVLGAMINFQFTLRESSLGIHNFKYSKALLTNSIEAMTAAGY